MFIDNLEHSPSTFAIGTLYGYVDISYIGKTRKNLFVNFIPSTLLCWDCHLAQMCQQSHVSTMANTGWGDEKVSGGGEGQIFGLV